MGIGKKKNLKNKLKSGGEEGDKKVTGRKGQKHKKGQREEQHGGSWQQFMAWVPNGAALMNPEPWKPLPQLGNGVGLASSGVKSQKASGNSTSVSPSGQFWGILPGAVPDDRK